MTQRAKKGRLSYVTSFYLGKLKAAILVTTASDSDWTDKSAFQSCCSKICMTGNNVPIQCEKVTGGSGQANAGMQQRSDQGLWEVFVEVFLWGKSTSEEIANVFLIYVGIVHSAFHFPHLAKQHQKRLHQTRSATTTDTDAVFSHHRVPYIH
eukprot:scaffold530_cov148-Skeletonema_marinoi.AAC.5